MKRVIAYCRVSSNLKDQELSLTSQITYYTNLLSNDSNFLLLGIFYDIGSGLFINKREGFKHVINLIKLKKIDIIYCKNISRLLRDTEDLLVFLNLCIKNHVQIKIDNEFYGEIEKSILELNLYAAISQYEIECKSLAIRWAYKRGFEKGCVYMTRLYGYESRNTNIIINEEEALIIREAFELYLLGMSETNIADIFNDKNLEQNMVKDVGIDQRLETY